MTCEGCPLFRPCPRSCPYLEELEDAEEAGGQPYERVFSLEVDAE